MKQESRRFQQWECQSMLVHRNNRLNPGSKPFDSDGANITFSEGDHGRLNVSSRKKAWREREIPHRKWRWKTELAELRLLAARVIS